MENASKALIIAGAILVSILIVSLGVFIFTQASGAAKKMANMDEQEIAAFNAKITPYLGESISGSQVNTLVQLALSNNYACVKNNELYKAITIEYPTSSSGKQTITVNDAGSVVEPDEKRVPTTGNAYYKVKGKYVDGLLVEITVE